MKPIKLIMSAFGSYGKRQEVDFAETNHGLFLVTGDTGAGKTTIFDAITYALYDVTSGGKRDGSMMRSQYAHAEDATYVSYTFSYGNEIYKVHRNPEYYRQGKRNKADGSPRLVKEPAKVELELPDGQLFQGKKKETDQKIEAIIGLSAEQFTQIGMIAQGDFLKLLHAESKERKRIFSKIFHTGLYLQMQEKLKEKAKVLYQQLESNEKDWERAVSDVWCEEESPYFEKWNIEITNKSKETIKVLKSMIEESMKKQIELRERINNLQKQTEYKQVQIAQGEQINRSLEMLMRQKEDKKQLLIQLDTQKKQLVQCEERHAQWQNRWTKEEPAIQKQCLEMEQLLPKYEQRNGIQQQLKECRQAIMLCSSQKKQLESAILEFTERQEVLGQKINRGRERIGAQEALELSMRQIHQEKKDLVLLEQKMQRYKKQSNEIKKAYELQIQQSKRCAGATLEYEKKYQLFLSEQAGILASTLEQGIPCPVCGATIHEKKAALSEHAPRETEVELAKQQRDQEEEKKQQYMEQLHRLQHQQEAEKSSIYEQSMRLFFCEIQLSDIIYVQTRYQEASKKLAEHKRTWEEIQQIKNDIKQDETEQSNLQHETVHTQKKIAECDETLQQLRLVQREVQTKEATLTKELGAEEEKAVRARKQNLLDQLGTLKKGYEKSVQDKQTLLGQIQLSEGKLQALTEQLTLQEAEVAGKETVELGLLKEEKCSLEQQLQEQQQQLMGIFGRNESNKSIYEKLNDFLLKQGQMQSQYEVWSNLSKTANGTLNQSAKIDFETYVQRQYFKQIINAANRRLIKMTSETFILQCRDIKNLGGQGQVGLDLDVYHLVSDSTRDVKTLSGGESFIASLAMALGLADIIQHASGAVRLDTMFVDEGFGSLDDQARVKAVQILHELAGESRLVGIISHVNELKEQIERKLIVSKTETGSVCQWACF